MVGMQRQPGYDVREMLIQRHLDVARDAWQRHAGTIGMDLVVLVLALDDAVGRGIAAGSGCTEEQLIVHRQRCEQAGQHPALVVAVPLAATRVVFTESKHEAIVRGLAAPLPPRAVRIIAVAGGGASMAVVRLGAVGDALS